MIIKNKVSRLKKKKNIHINSNTNYRKEMKLVPFNMDYCLLEFDTLKFYSRVRLHGGLILTSFFSMLIQKFDNEIVKFTAEVAWI